MIGMVRKDRRRAEQLLGEHRPRQQVRPGSAAEGEQQVGLRPPIVAMAVGGPDQEPRLAFSTVAPAFELRREFGRRQRLARVRRARSTRCCGGSAGMVPPRSGSSLTFVGQLIRFKYRSTSSASGDRPILPRATMCSSTYWRGARRRLFVAERPHSFQIVKISHFGTEQMDDHVVGVDQHPVGRGQALDPRRSPELAP